MALVMGFLLAASGAATEPVNGTTNDTFAATATDLNLPADFFRRVRQRALMDDYAARFHALEADVQPRPRSLTSSRNVNERMIQVVKPPITPAMQRRLTGLDEPVRPLRGYLAPILDRAELEIPVTLPATGLTPAEKKLAELVTHTLAREGLLVTLAASVEALGPAAVATDPARAAKQLVGLGFPVDLLAFFRGGFAPATNAIGVIAGVARELGTGATAVSLATRLRAVPFQFTKTHPAFRCAEETGENEIGLLRLQIGGGYVNGIVPGGPLDVTPQLMSALPEANVLATVPAGQFENVRLLALRSWPLRREGRLTLVSETAPVSAWAQDNGKAGVLTGTTPGRGVPATLTPRYASMDEMDQKFMPGESFLMDGLRAAGHTVLHSPLLFQGGNLLVARDPRRGDRVLVLSETELYRNMALGLTRKQVLDAFRAEFAVDRTVVLPAISYHLDYDLALRVQAGGVTAFVNDPLAAARIVLARGLEALESAGEISRAEAYTARGHLEAGELAAFGKEMEAVLGRFRNADQTFRLAFVRLFAAIPTDAPMFNTRCFLAALDILASEALTGANEPPPGARRDYLAALRDLHVIGRAQQEQLRGLGWTVVPVPSMPDLHRSLNYVNGVQDRAKCLIPAIGGFYQGLDQAAAAAYQRALGTGVKVIPIQSAGIQISHGGVHCVSATYPKLDGE